MFCPRRVFPAGAVVFLFCLWLAAAGNAGQFREGDFSEKDPPSGGDLFSSEPLLRIIYCAETRGNLFPCPS